MKTFVSIFMFIYLFLTINTAQAVDLKYAGSVTILSPEGQAIVEKNGFVRVR